MASSTIDLTEPNVITEEWKISALVTTQSISTVRLEQFTSHQISAPQQDLLAAPENCQRDDWPHVNSWTQGRNACMACLIEQEEVLTCFPALRRTRWTGCTDADSGVSACALKALQAFKKHKPISDTDAPLTSRNDYHPDIKRKKRGGKSLIIRRKRITQVSKLNKCFFMQFLHSCGWCVNVNSFLLHCSDLRLYF